MAHEAPASNTTNFVPQPRSGEPPSASEGAQTGVSSSGAVRSLSFGRLLTAAVLTPGQASFVAVHLLDAAARSGTVEGPYPPGARLGAVTLTPSGEVDVGPSPADEGTPVTELLNQLLQNARRLPAHPRPEQLSLLHRLEQAAADPVLEPGSRARELEGALADTLGSGYKKRVSGQLAALVEAFAHVAPSVPASIDAVPGPLTTGTPVVSHRATWAPPNSSRPTSRRARARVASTRPDRSRVLIHRRGRGWRVALVVLVVAAVLAGGGYLLARGPAAGVLGALASGNQPAAQNKTAPAQPSTHHAKHQRAHRHHSPAVPALAGRHAGAVTQVTVQKAGSCKPGARCPVKVTVHLRPSSTARVVGWKVGAARLCKRGLAWSPGTTVTARPGWTTVYAHSSVRVPKGRSLALVALTTTPARAQSQPIPVTGSSLRC